MAMNLLSKDKTLKGYSVHIFCAKARLHIWIGVHEVRHTMYDIHISNDINDKFTMFTNLTEYMKATAL